MARQKYTYAQLQCIRSAGRLSQSTGMLRPHARVGIAVSGGVDSSVLLEVMRIRQGIVPFPFSIMALHVNPGFDPLNHAPMAAWLREHGVAAHLETTDHGLRAHSPENRRGSACFYCAMLRRKRLFELCKEYKLTHLAFGHTAEDLVSTFFMNFCQNGRIDGMSMTEAFFGGALHVIRPLMLMDKKTIIKAHKAWALPLWKNPCPSAGFTRRSSVMDDAARIWQNNKNMEKTMTQALVRWQFAKHRLPPEEQ